MSVNYNFRKGIDSPTWQWLAFFPVGASNGGTSNVWDGNRYIYWAVQYSTTATSSGTAVLYRYDTWTNGWQYLVTLTSGNMGIDLEYDAVRNVVYIINGSGLNSWQVFNLNTTAVTVVNQSIPAWSLATISVTLPTTASYGASLTMPNDVEVATPTDTGTVDTSGNTTTQIQATAATGTFGAGMVNMQVTVLTGSQAGQKRTITGITAPNVISVTPALPGALASGDTFQIEMVNDIATAGSTTTLTDTTANWTVNAYANMDVIITGGTGSGQRRRITSNTATVLTLAAAVTGNTRTGAFTTAPDATSTYKIVPSSDFIYFQPGNNSTSLYRIDVAATTGTAWSGALAAAPGGISGGGNTFYPAAYAPYQIVAFRGNGTSNTYLYNIGTNTWTSLAVFSASETFNTGAAAAMVPGKRKILVQKEGQSRLYALDLLTGIYEPAGTMPYATPGSYDGKRGRVVTTPDGAMFLYLLRAGGQEFFRVPLEWY